LADHWTEVEAIFKAALDEPFNQVQYATALWIRAEVDAGLVPAARRELLTRAAGLLRPLAQQGKLMRRDREWVLAGIERELAR
jgi:hypothetical protein